MPQSRRERRSWRLTGGSAGPGAGDGPGAAASEFHPPPLVLGAAWAAGEQCEGGCAWHVRSTKKRKAGSPERAVPGRPSLEGPGVSGGAAGGGRTGPGRRTTREAAGAPQMSMPATLAFILRRWPAGTLLSREGSVVLRTLRVRPRRPEAGGPPGPGAAAVGRGAGCSGPRTDAVGRHSP